MLAEAGAGSLIDEAADSSKCYVDHIQILHGIVVPRQLVWDNSDSNHFRAPGKQ